jgi:hypothetical protein
MMLICHKCLKSAPESKFKMNFRSSTCPNCGHLIEYYDPANPPNIPDKFRKQIIDRFMVEATPGECLFQFFWSHRFEYGYQAQGDFFETLVHRRAAPDEGHKSGDDAAC